MDEQAAQVLVPALRDAHQHLAIAAGELPRDEADPGGERATVLELRAVADRGDDRCRGLRPDALDPGDALAGLARAEHPVDLPVEQGDPAVEIADEIIELADRFAGQRRQLVLEVGQDLGDRPAGANNHSRLGQRLKSPAPLRAGHGLGREGARRRPLGRLADAVASS